MSIFNSKIVLITGGAGSVGCALAREILKYDPKTIRIFDLSENGMFKMRTDFGREKRMRYLIGDIRDINRLKLAMEDVDIVVHLAAMKHVYTCEYNPFEAIKTNIDGLQNVIDVARNENVEKMVFASTDKAASPSNVMGMTKLLGEKLISLANYYVGDSRRTIFVSVRFGNVMGSNGSALPLFKKQIISGGPLTITDKEMTRFVITMNEAVNLICRAVELGKGGETFVWKMRTLKMIDLVDVMIEKYGLGRDIEIDTIGKCKGEKMHEEIMSEDEIFRAVEMDNLYVVRPLISDGLYDHRYENVKSIEAPVVISNRGIHMTKQEIEQLVERIEV